MPAARARGSLNGSHFGLRMSCAVRHYELIGEDEASNG